MPAQITYNEKELLQRIAFGDESAFAAIYQQYADQIYSVALIYSKSVAQAEDTVQAVFLKCWEERFRLPQIEKLDAWLFILARNHVLGQLRRNAVHQSYIQQLKETMNFQLESPEYELLRREQWKLLQHAVEALSPQQRTAFMLQREEGLSYSEIADRMGIAINTVRVHLHKAMDILRTQLRENGPSGAVILFLLLAE